MMLIIIGVAGAGKTTIGKLLAQKLGWKFYDADDFHPPKNIRKIKEGIPLTDSDRWPWLASLRELIEKMPGPSVIACSAIKKSYRDYLSEGNKDIEFVFLKGSKGVILHRLADREGHFTGPDILDSQFRDLEEPRDALTEEVTEEPESIVSDIIKMLNL